MRATRRPNTLSLLVWLVGSLMIGFVLAPLFALSATQTPASLGRVAQMAEVQQAIGLSIEASLIAVIIAALAGVPFAYGLARSQWPGRSVVDAIVDLPIAVPHTVAGIALLIVFGRDGTLGAPADALFGLRVSGHIGGHSRRDAICIAALRR